MSINTTVQRTDAIWEHVTQVPGSTAIIPNHYRCRVCGRVVKSHGNFGGGIKAHGMMHVRRNEAEEFYAGRGRSTHLEFRIIQPVRPISAVES